MSARQRDRWKLAAELAAAIRKAAQDLGSPFSCEIVAALDVWRAQRPQDDDADALLCVLHLGSKDDAVKAPPAAVVAAAEHLVGRGGS